jgi:hypothetical protein
MSEPRDRDIHTHTISRMVKSCDKSNITQQYRRNHCDGVEVHFAFNRGVEVRIERFVCKVSGFTPRVICDKFDTLLSERFRDGGISSPWINNSFAK